MSVQTQNSLPRLQRDADLQPWSKRLIDELWKRLYEFGIAINTMGAASPFTPQADNVVFAGPAAGPNALPAFRALVTNDFPSTGVAASTYGDSTHVGQFTVDVKGRLTSASSVSIAFPAVTWDTDQNPLVNQVFGG